MTLSRAYRIQTTVVLLDRALRNDKVGLGCTDQQHELFNEIGNLIRTMLTPPCNKKISDDAAEELLDRLGEIRDGVLQESVEVAASASTQRELFCTSLGREKFKEMLGTQMAMPLCVHSRENCSLLFLQLVEQPN